MLSDKQKEQYGELAFSVLSRMVGGDAKAYFQSEQTTAMVWSACKTNTQILHLVGMYLAGDSSRAELNLGRLRDYLREYFDLDRK
jgi:hypothetical protein